VLHLLWFVCVVQWVGEYNLDVSCAFTVHGREPGNITLLAYQPPAPSQRVSIFYSVARRQHFVLILVPGCRRWSQEYPTCGPCAIYFSHRRRWVEDFLTLKER